jgi:hypothetical protein
MTVQRSDLSDEEWEALHRLNRGQPEAGLVPPLMQDLLIEFGLATRRRGEVAISPAGKRMVLKHKNEDQS